MTDLRCRLLTALVSARIATFAIILLAALAFSARADSVPNPTVTGPISSPDVPGAPTHNYPFFASNHNLPTHGFVEQEFYFQGTANRYNTPSLVLRFNHLIQLICPRIAGPAVSS
jgi:hypothetical protein